MVLNQKLAAGFLQWTRLSSINMNQENWVATVFQKFQKSGSIVWFAGAGLMLRRKKQHVRSIFLINFLDGAFPEMYPFASNQKYGMTVCAPIMDENNAFTGAFCQDLLPTLNYGNSSSQNFDNYLGNMYMSLDKINYILFDKDLFVRYQSYFISIHSGSKTILVLRIT
jgi:hypothetical protein